MAQTLSGITVVVTMQLRGRDSIARFLMPSYEEARRLATEFEEARILWRSDWSGGATRLGSIACNSFA